MVKRSDSGFEVYRVLLSLGQLLGHFLRGLPHHARTSVTARGPSWGHPMVVLGTIRSFLEPFCGHLSPKIDKVSERQRERDLY